MARKVKTTNCGTISLRATADQQRTDIFSITDNKTTCVMPIYFGLDDAKRLHAALGKMLLRQRKKKPLTDDQVQDEALRMYNETSDYGFVDCISWAYQQGRASKY